MSDKMCWIFGDESNSAFPTRITKYKTIGELRVAIKAQNDLAFQHVDARSIALWKVSEHLILCTLPYRA
jgi:hypothetical protein